jgi:menaquinone-dependent protoporphyrinogen oxidase
MKPIGILYATRDGHTRRIAEHVATDLHERGFSVELKNVADAAHIRPSDYDGAVLAASVRCGEHEHEMVKFVKDHVAELDNIPTAFVSVTLTEAGVERPESSPEERAKFAADVQRVIDRFFEETGWRATRIKAVAGALLYTKYNLLLRFVMKQIAKSTHGDTDTSRDYEYTDWAALDRFVDEFAAGLGAAMSEPLMSSARA